MKKTFVLMAATILFSAITAKAQTKEAAIQKTLNERYESAETDFKNLISITPSNGDLYFSAGDNYFYWGEFDQAEAMYRKGMEAAPNNPLNYAGLGRVAWNRNDVTVNKAQFAKAEEIMKSKAAKVDKGTQQLAYLKMAEVYLQSEKKDLETAIVYINLALNLNDKNPEVYIQLGDYYAERDVSNLSNAVMEYNKALTIDPKYTRAILRKGMLYVRVKNWTLARDHFDEAIALDPNFAPAYREKAELLYKAGDYGKAIEAYAKYLELNNNCRVQQRYASFVFLTKDYKRAVTELEKALPCNADNPFMYRLLGYSYYETGDFAKGTENLDKFFAMAKEKGKPSIIGSDYAYRGKLMSKNGLDSLAIDQFKLSIEKDSTYLDGYSDIAAIYQKQKKHDLAAQYYKMKIGKSKEPLQLDIYYLARSYYSNKEYQKADAEFEKASKSYPTDAAYWRARCNDKQEVNAEAPAGLAKPFYELFITKVGVDPKAIETNKKNLVEAYSYLGFFNYTQKNFDCSKVAYSKVLEFDPANEKAKIAVELPELKSAPGTCVLITPAP
jgi:tetratricopeptide (TPR) repeat protein